MTEDRCQRSEVRGQKTENRGQMSEVRSQRTEDRKQRTDDRGQKSEDRRQKTEVRGQTTEDRKQMVKTGTRSTLSDFDSAVFDPELRPKGARRRLFSVPRHLLLDICLLSSVICFLSSDL
jgi:hypothetical protein